MAEELGWRSFRISELLPRARAQHLKADDLNQELAWLFQIVPPEHFQPRVALVGVLKASSQSGRLQIMDQSGAVDCVVLQDSSDGRYSQFVDTCILGSLIQVDRYQLVVEYFIESEFPSWRQLEDARFIKEKYCRLYVQFVTGDVHVLNRSAALAKRDLQRKAGESSVKGTPRQKQPCPSGLPGAAENSCIPSEDSETSHRAKVPRMEQVGNCIGEVAGSNQDDTHPAETASLSPSGSESCVTLLFLVTQKEGPMLKNSQLNVPGCPTNSRAPPPLLLSFEVLALQIGEPRVWANRGEMQGIPEIQDVCRNFTELRLLFLSDSVKWCSCIHPERLYRLVVPQSTDVMVFKNFGCQRWNSPLCLTLQDGWEVQYVADLSALSPYQASFWPQISESLQLHSISEIQSKSFSHTLVSFIGRVCDRVTCAPDIRLQYTTFLTGKKDEDIFHRSDLCLKLDVCDPSDASRCLTVYIDFTLLPHVPGLLPGAMVLFYRHERIFSRSCYLYCKYVPCSCVSVIGHPAPLDTHRTPGLVSPDLSSLRSMDLSELVLNPERSLRGVVCCYVPYILNLTLQWVCSQCSCIFKQGRCTRHFPPCQSDVGIFSASARAAAVQRMLCPGSSGDAALGIPCPGHSASSSSTGSSTQRSRTPRVPSRRRT
ncbi:CST complex subunit CTC1-like [Latimeria chalumnae]|uniref:CST complex subunit CTC1-like n=1 Tax=Latimeria chalumnae TaxID=7897 RepID=UPI00313E5539